MIKLLEAYNANILGFKRVGQVPYVICSSYDCGNERNDSL